MTENCKFHKAILSAFYNISQPKLWNIANFVMLFQTVMKILSRLVEFEILFFCGIAPLAIVFDLRLVSTQENYPWIGTDKKVFLCLVSSGLELMTLTQRKIFRE